MSSTGYYYNVYDAIKDTAFRNSDDDAMSRSNTCEAQLDGLGTSQAGKFDQQCRDAYKALLRKSLQLPAESRLVMYDPHDEEEISKPSGPYTIRLDARRGSKPKAPPSPKVMVCNPVDPSKFNFTKIKNAEERILHLELQSSPYVFLTNKFPLCSCHMLLVTADVQPQQMTLGHLNAILEFLRGSKFCAYFNSWGAAASVNHLHFHVIDEQPPITAFELKESTAIIQDSPVLQMEGYPGEHYVFHHHDACTAWAAILAMQQHNQPHNLFFSGEHIYIFPRPLNEPHESRDLYDEMLGGLEMTGVFTVYSSERYVDLDADKISALLGMNTAELPAALFGCSANSCRLSDTSGEDSEETVDYPSDASN